VRRLGHGGRGGRGYSTAAGMEARGRQAGGPRRGERPGGARERKPGRRSLGAAGGWRVHKASDGWWRGSESSEIESDRGAQRFFG
jgi:hypothetical protein